MTVETLSLLALQNEGLFGQHVHSFQKKSTIKYSASFAVISRQVTNALGRTYEKTPPYPLAQNRNNGP